MIVSLMVFPNLIGGNLSSALHQGKLILMIGAIR
jgi:hypothetical protein